MSGGGLQSVEYGKEPSVLLFADSDAGLDRLRLASDRLGYRISDTGAFEDALERLERQAAVNAVLLAVEQDHGTNLDALVGAIGEGADAGRFGAVICTPLELTDPVFAKAPGRNVIQLCGWGDRDLLASVAAAAAPKTIRLNDSGRGTARLQQLSEEVGRIASLLASISEEGALAEIPAAQDGPGELTAGAVRAMLRARRLREQYFPTDLFADPAWDMLLDLMAARLEGQKVAVSSLCIAAACPRPPRFGGSRR